MRFSIRLMLILVAFVAVTCFILFAAPPILRVPILFVAVIVMPVPIVVMLRHGRQKAQLFALGSLIGYAVWLTIGGIPCAVFVAYRFMASGIPTESNIRWTIERFIGSYYPGYVGLYAPWLIVPLAGVIAIIAHWLMDERNSH